MGGCSSALTPTSALRLPHSRSADGYRLARQRRCGPIGGADAALLRSCHRCPPPHSPPSGCPQLCPDPHRALSSGSPSLHPLWVSSAPSRTVAAIGRSVDEAAVSNTWPDVTVVPVVTAPSGVCGISRFPLPHPGVTDPSPSQRSASRQLIASSRLQNNSGRRAGKPRERRAALVRSQRRHTATVSAPPGLGDPQLHPHAELGRDIPVHTVAFLGVQNRSGSRTRGCEHTHVCPCTPMGTNASVRPQLRPCMPRTRPVPHTHTLQPPLQKRPLRGGPAAERGLLMEQPCTAPLLLPGGGLQNHAGFPAGKLRCSTAPRRAVLSACAHRRQGRACATVHGVCKWACMEGGCVFRGARVCISACRCVRLRAGVLCASAHADVELCGCVRGVCKYVCVCADTCTLQGMCVHTSELQGCACVSQSCVCRHTCVHRLTSQGACEQPCASMCARSKAVCAHTRVQAPGLRVQLCVRMWMSQGV